MNYSEPEKSQQDPQGSEEPRRQGSPVHLNLPAKKPIVTNVILVVTVLVYLVQMATQNLLGADLPFVYLAKINSLILSGEIWRLFTPAFVHGSILHIGFNMYALYIFGRNLEYQYGNGRFALLYWLAAFAGNVASFVMSPNPSIGASTAIFGLVAAEGVFIFRNRRFFGNRARPILMNIVLILAVNLILGLSPGIDNWGHLGGLLGGLVFAWTAGPVWAMQIDVQGYRLEDEQSPSKMILGTLVILISFGVLAATRWF